MNLCEPIQYTLNQRGIIEKQNWGKVNFANINRYDNNVKLRAKSGSLFTYRIVFLSEDISSTSVFKESQLCSDKVCI